MDHGTVTEENAIQTLSGVHNGQRDEVQGTSQGGDPGPRAQAQHAADMGLRSALDMLCPFNPVY